MGRLDIDLITKGVRKDISGIVDKEAKLLSDEEIKSIINACKDLKLLPRVEFHQLFQSISQ